MSARPQPIRGFGPQASATNRRKALAQNSSSPSPALKLPAIGLDSQAIPAFSTEKVWRRVGTHKVAPKLANRPPPSGVSPASPSPPAVQGKEELSVSP